MFFLLFSLFTVHNGVIQALYSIDMRHFIKVDYRRRIKIKNATKCNVYFVYAHIFMKTLQVIIYKFSNDELFIHCKKKVSDIPTGEGKIGNLFLQRIFIIMLYHAHIFTCCTFLHTVLVNV
jgi:hypothetical protein